MSSNPAEIAILLFHHLLSRSPRFRLPLPMDSSIFKPAKIEFIQNHCSILLNCMCTDQFRWSFSWMHLFIMMKDRIEILCGNRFFTHRTKRKIICMPIIIIYKSFINHYEKKKIIIVFVIAFFYSEILHRAEF